VPAPRNAVSQTTRATRPGHHAHVSNEAWVEGRPLVETVEDLELTLRSRRAAAVCLFHQRGVRVFRNTELVAQCLLARQRRGDAALVFGDRDDMVENGVISVTIRSRTYVFEPAEVKGSE
jgi:molecular chaperone Hsp33